MRFLASSVLSSSRALATARFASAEDAFSGSASLAGASSPAMAMRVVKDAFTGLTGEVAAQIECECECNVGSVTVQCR